MIIQAAREGSRVLVVTPNVDHILRLYDDAELVMIYRSADFVFADGMPLVWLSKLLPGESLPGRVTGADLLPEVCRMAVNSGLKVIFMGGNPGVAERAAEVLQIRFPGLKVAGTYFPPFGFEHSELETEKMITFCNAHEPDLLFFGVGSPKQERWAAAQLPKLKVGVLLCVGAAFDFASGDIRRAPLMMQNLGIEWLWRLLSEPQRLWRRYLLCARRFVVLAIREVLSARFGI